jgi:hypothetical protein
VESFALTLTNPFDAFGLPSWPRAWQEVGQFTDRQIAHWERALAGAAGNGFLYILTFLVVTGVKRTNRA